MKFAEIRNKIYLTLGICVIVLIFFLLTVHVWDNTGENFVYSSYQGSKSEIIIDGYTGNPVNLEIPKEIEGFSVVAIGESAFAGNTELKKVSVPSSVKYINDYAFSGCSSLKTVVLEDGVLSVGYRAFYKCEYLRNVELPSTLETIDDEAFRDCERLKTLEIPKSCSKIGTDAFRACMSLTLDCSQNDMAKEYAQKNYIPTDFSASSDYTILKVIVISLLTVVGFFVIVTVIKKVFGKKEEVDIRFIDSEMSRKDKYKDGLVSDDPCARTSAKKLWLNKNTKEKMEIKEENQEKNASSNDVDPESNE